MTQIPPELNFNQLQTKGFFSVFKQWPIQPVTNGGQYWPGQIIRIFLNDALNQGVMDPYKSHLQITVQCQQKTLPVGLLQVDNSAQSFIQQMIISSKNRQVQRITQYGSLAAYLSDVGMCQIFSQGRQVQGLGYNNINTTSQAYQPSFGGSTSNFWNKDLNNNFSIGSSGSIFPTIPSKFQTGSAFGSQIRLLSQQQGATRGHNSLLNSSWLSYKQSWWWGIFSGIEPMPDNDDPKKIYNTRPIDVGYYGYCNNIRAQYISNISNCKYIDSTSSLSNYQIRLDLKTQNFTFPAKFQNQTVYKVYTPQLLDNFTMQSDTKYSAYQSKNSVSTMGFTSLYSPYFCRGVNQPFISPTVPQCQMQNGNILPFKIPISRRTFKIPIISALIGLLIPQNQFILLPLKALTNLMLEFTIDPFAMFTSGYNDIAQFDNVGMGLMQKRAFKVTRVIYNLHSYQFFNPQLNQFINVNLTSGIALNTHMWQLGNQYQVQNSQTLTNAWQIACNAQVLNQVVVLFYPLDYLQYSFCRKHFRLSNNITSFYLRANMNFYPPQPLAGNGGCPIQIDSSGDNSVYLNQIYYANGYMFSNSTPKPRINAYNFAINQRCYNIGRSDTFYDPDMIDNYSFQWMQNSVNSDTALGMSNIHQNRYVGKAAYVYSFQPYSHSQNYIMGLNCRASTQFQVNFVCNPQGYFPRPQVMFIFTRSSNIVQYGKQGIVIINN